MTRKVLGRSSCAAKMGSGGEGGGEADRDLPSLRLPRLDVLWRTRAFRSGRPFPSAVGASRVLPGSTSFLTSSETLRTLATVLNSFSIPASFALPLSFMLSRSTNYRFRRAFNSATFSPSANCFPISDRGL